MTDYNTTPLDEALLRKHDVPSDVINAFQVHFQLLLRWNKVHNLTRVTHPGEATLKHYLDSWLGVVATEALLPTKPWEEGVWDIGSGAGFPGIACALRWQTPITWIDPSSKRASFLTMVKQTLQLDHVTVQTGRLQDLPNAALAKGLMVSRATFPWEKWRGHLNAQPQSSVALWCGKDPEAKMWSDAMAPHHTKQSEVQLPDAEFRQILVASPPAP